MTKHANNLLAPTTTQFSSGGLKCTADFFRPSGAGPFPVIVMAHGLGGTRNMRLPAYAERFAAAGYACLVFDYRHFGDSEGGPRQLIDVKRQLEDWKSAVLYARSLGDVDPNRVILWGSSFSGGHVLSTAAEDHKVAAVISQGLFTDGLASSLAMEPIVSAKLSILAVADRVGALFGAKPIMVPVAGRPGDTALMTAPDGYDGYYNLLPPGATANNSAAARVALDIIRYYPGRKTPKIQAPVLFQVCNSDSVAPAKKTLSHANRTPRKEIKRYDYGHFDIYVGDAFEHVVTDQLDFLKRTVPRRACNR